MFPAPQHPDGADSPDGDEFEVPELPLARPGEAATASSHESHNVVRPRRLGGGASLTAVGGVEQDQGALPQADRRRETDPAELEWEITSRLVAGMLANPARSHSSVKDAISLFDHMLHELRNYRRLSSEFEQPEREQRRVQGPARSEPAQPAPRPDRRGTPLPRPTNVVPPSGGNYVPGSMAGAPPTEDEDADSASRG